MIKMVKVLISNVGLDHHAVGGIVLSQGLRDAGMEVIYLGVGRTPEEIVRTAIQEDVDVIGISIYSGAHEVVAQDLMQLLEDNGMRENIMVIFGGVIPPQDASKLKSMGVMEVFPPACNMKIVANFLKQEFTGRQM